MTFALEMIFASEIRKWANKVRGEWNTILVCVKFCSHSLTVPDKCVHSGAGNDKNKTNFNVRTEKNCPTYVPFISNKTSIVILFHLYFYSEDCLTFHIRI